MPAWYTARKLRTRKGRNFQNPMTSLCKGESDITTCSSSFSEPRDLGSTPTSASNTLASWFQAGHFTPLHHRFLLARTPGGQTGSTCLHSFPPWAPQSCPAGTGLFLISHWGRGLERSYHCSWNPWKLKNQILPVSHSTLWQRGPCKKLGESQIGTRAPRICNWGLRLIVTRPSVVVPICHPLWLDQVLNPWSKFWTHFPRTTRHEMCSESARSAQSYSCFLLCGWHLESSKI